MERSTMKQVTRQRLLQCPPRSAAWFAGALGGSLVLFACIQREAVVKEPAGSTSTGSTSTGSTSTGSTSTAVASTTAAETTAAKPTGNYGKVLGVDVLGGAGIHAFRVHGAADRVA